MLKAFVPTLPEEAVAVGGSWEKEDSMNVGPGRDAKVVNRYTLRDVEDGAATIASTFASGPTCTR